VSLLPRIVLVAIAASALALGACKSPCRQLSEKLCECEPNTLERENCLQQASADESRADPTAEDHEVCAALLDKCDCTQIDTPEGKRNCGLAR